MSEALIVFKSAGHIRFGLGGEPADVLENNNTEFLPVIVIPITSTQTYYRRFYIQNLDYVPYYRWGLSVKTTSPITARLSYCSDNSEVLLNAATPPKSASSWKTTVYGSEINKPILDINELASFWLQISASSSALNSMNSYTIELIFEGYA